jgi:type IV pilus assembly protein PilA
MGGKMKIKNSKGFTLIELLIVVAIIAILAAIAIPQFSKYRIRGYNSAADSDLRNVKIALEAFNTDNQVYPSTPGGCTVTNGIGTCTGGAPANGTIIAGPASYVITFAIGSILAGPPAVPAAVADIKFGLSNNVSASVSTDATAVAYVLQTASAPGDTIYAADSDSTSLFRAGKDSTGAAVAPTDGVPGAPMAAGAVITSVSGAVDIASPYVAM